MRIFVTKWFKRFAGKASLSNKKLKEKLGWVPRVSMAEGLRRYFEACRERGAHA